MDTTARQWQVPEGKDVLGSDGHKVGEVIGENNAYLVVKKGFFFPTDYYVPMSAIANFDGDKVTLNVTKDEALHQGWDVIPGDETAGTSGGAFLTGATGYDEPTGFVSAEGVELTDADLRVAGTFTPEDSLGEARIPGDDAEESTDDLPAERDQD
jgi:hypothetical protein